MYVIVLVSNSLFTSWAWAACDATSWKRKSFSDDDNDDDDNFILVSNINSGFPQSKDTNLH